MFLSSRIHRNFSPRRFGALVVSGVLVASIAGLASVNPATAAHVEGVEYAGNEDCDSIAPDGVAWDEFKIDDAPTADDSPYELGDGLEITISNASSQGFDWASNFDMAAVLVKGGALDDQGGGGGVHYNYPGDDDMSDRACTPFPTRPRRRIPRHQPRDLLLPGRHRSDVDDHQHSDYGGRGPDAETPAAVVPAAEEVKTTVLGETLVAGDTLPRTGAAATNMLVLAGGLGLAFGLMMLMLGRRKTAIHSS